MAGRCLRRCCPVRSYRILRSCPRSYCFEKLNQRDEEQLYQYQVDNRDALQVISQAFTRRQINQPGQDSRIGPSFYERTRKSRNLSLSQQQIEIR